MFIYNCVYVQTKGFKIEIRCPSKQMVNIILKETIHRNEKGINYLKKKKNRKEKER